MKQAVKNGQASEAYSKSLSTRLLIMVIYFVIMFLSYYVMLIVMTFNAGLFVATVLGLTVGYSVFLMAPKADGKIYNPQVDKCCTDMD
mmetsp:Transcript_41852/g.64035  ORF Transcript_41852/g.64035 Transcript_41852/m.64035 type:complete len:88 (-) Transcript_41852:49-312(-)